MLTAWWMAPEWGKGPQHKYPDRRDSKMQRLPTSAEYDEKRKKWVGIPIRVYVASVR